MNYRFRGTFQFSIDEKGRLNIPARFRKALRREADETFVATIGKQKSVLVYPKDAWMGFEQKILNLHGKNEELIRRMLLDNSIDSELDKQGRITLTQAQRQWADIDKEVIIVGNLDHLLLWNPNRYNELHKTDSASFDDLYEKVLDVLENRN